MKRKLNIIKLAAVAIFIAGGCSKDDSSGPSNQIKQIVVTDEKSTAVISILQGETLTLNPSVTHDQSIQDSDLEYEWLAYNNAIDGVTAAVDTIISKQRELKFVVKDPPFTLGQKYRVRFGVKNKRTGITAYLGYNIIIGNILDQGWLVLEEKNGNGDLSMILPNGDVVRNIYTTRNTTPLIGPKKLELSPFDVTDDISAAGKRMYILANTNSQEYNYLTMAKKYDLNFLFFKAPATNDFKRITWIATRFGTYLYANLGIAIDGNGKVYSNLVGGFSGVKKWGDITVTPQGNLNYNVDSFIAGGTTYNAVVYDNQGKKFYNVGANALQAFPLTASTAFDMNNVGLDMVFQDSSSTLYEYNAIMKTAANQAYFLKYKTASTGAAPAVTLTKVLINAPDILSLNFAAASTLTPHIYYCTTSKISTYETTSNTASLSYQFGSGENITAVKYQKANNAKLVVATWDGTVGKIYYFPISSAGVLSSYNKVITGFNRIVDIAYKF